MGAGNYETCNFVIGRNNSRCGGSEQVITVINCRKLGAGCWKRLILVRKRLLVVENGPLDGSDEFASDLCLLSLL